jgi:hypothetical protein
MTTEVHDADLIVQAIKPRHETTVKALRTLAALKPGQRITYEELARKIGADPQAEGRQYVSSARRILQKARKMVIEPYEEIGLVYLTDAQLGTSGRRRIRKVYRTAKRESKRLACVNDMSALSLEEREKWARHQAILQDAEMRLSAPVVNRVELATSTDGGGIDLNAIVEAFRKGTRIIEST